MDIQRYSEERADEIADLFYQSVHAIDESIYTAQQKAVWAPYPIDYERWSQRLSEKQPLLAVIDNRVAGFIELDGDGHIDCTYTHPDYQGKGVASALYEALVRLAKERGLERLYVEASFIAKPFFEKRGFISVEKNDIVRDGVTLVNFSMVKHL